MNQNYTFAQEIDLRRHAEPRRAAAGARGPPRLDTRTHENNNRDITYTGALPEARRTNHEMLPSKDFICGRYLQAHA
jgi:hypothetical protein